MEGARESQSKFGAILESGSVVRCVMLWSKSRQNKKVLLFQIDKIKPLKR
jgi:hypothetical protein